MCRETPFYISHVFNVDHREFVPRRVEGQRPARWHIGTHARALFTIPLAVAPTNKSPLAVARMEIF